MAIRPETAAIALKIFRLKKEDIPAKEVARRLGLTWSNLRKIISRFRNCHKKDVAGFWKNA